MGRPRLLLADEPTALHSANARQVVDILTGLAAGDTAVLIATHDPRVSEQCGRTIRLEDGRLVSDEPAPATLET